jgi:hypothetical protein
MSRDENILTVLMRVALLCITSCENLPEDKSLPDNIIADDASTSIQQNSFPNTDSLSVQKDDLTQIYAQSISEFIRAAFKNNKTTFDSLFFGKHIYGQTDDFPDIELPKSIEKTQIRLVSPELGQKIQSQRKSLVYVNMVGWVDKKQTEFFFIVFSDGGKHQYDYFVDFT